MKIFISGANGMVGRNLYENAILAKHELLGPPRAELDLRDYSSVENWMKKNKPDVVIHGAGKVGGIQANINSPVSFLVENLDVGRNVLLAARAAGVKRLLNLGSSCMYPREAKNPLHENLILQGELEPTNEGYALAKIATQRLAAYIRKENPDFHFKTLVPCNLYGRFDNFDPVKSHLVPAVLRKLHDAKKGGDVEIWGDGKARREFMYAGDLADFIAKMLPKFEEIPDVINVGLGHDYSINEYYEAGAKVTGYVGEFRHDLSKPVGMKQKLVATDLQTQLGWKPPTSLEDGLRKTYDFFVQQGH